MARTQVPVNMGAAEFHALYGKWQALAPSEAVALFEGFTRPWWIIGGWAIDAFTGQSREHEDLDVAVFREDAEALRTFVEGRLHAWAVGEGTLRPFNHSMRDLPDWAGQLWLRLDAQSAWLLDINLQLGHDGFWQSKRDSAIRAPLGTTTFTDSMGIRYQNPALVLLHKAAHHRPKDDLDLRRTVPLLDPDQLIWLRQSLQRLHVGHPWLPLVQPHRDAAARLSSGTPSTNNERPSPHSS
jgi:hypothetical protein